MAVFGSQSLISMVITVHNGGDHFPVCFDSWCRLSYPEGRLEIHLIDDFSTDGTREFLKQQIPPCHIHLHYSRENLGRSRACNLGLSYAKGDIMILLDGDMEVPPDFVKQHVAELSKSGREVIIGRVEPATWLPRTKLNRYLYESTLRGARQFGTGGPIGFQYLIFNNTALSRAAVEAGGTFEESFTHYGGKDILFAYRIARSYPNTIYYSDQPVSFHHQNRLLPAHLKLLYEYGYHNLPQIIDRHPEIATLLAADFAWPFDSAFSQRRQRKGRLFFNGITHSLARLLLPLAPAPLSSRIVRFLVVSSVVRGLRCYVRTHQIQAQCRH